MAINFPNSPSANDQHTASGITWTWDGTTWKADGGTDSYILPTASATVLGGVKVGTNLSINSAGELSATATGSPSGSDTQVQFNDGGSFGGDGGLRYSKSNDELTAHDITLIKDSSNATPLLSMPDSGEIKIGPNQNGAYQTIIQIDGIKLGRNNNHMFFEWQDSTPGITYKLPNASPTANGQVLSSTTTGTMSWIGNSGLQSRVTYTATTASIANNAADNISVVAHKSYALLKIKPSIAAWVVLYVDDASRTADASRTQGADPAPDAGVIAEVVTTAANQEIKMSPGVLGWHQDGGNDGVNTVFCKVVNKSGSTGTCTVSLTVVQLEA